MIIVITGTSSGIGFETAKDLLERGHQVIGVSRREPFILKEYKTYTHFKIDLSDLDNIEKHLKAVLKNQPNINALVCNAGVGLFGYLEQLPFKKIQKMINVNLMSQIAVARAFLPSFKTRKRGTMIFIGSEAALEGKTQGSAYCASKFALRGFTQALRKEALKSNVRISLINPGIVKTPFFDPLHFSFKDEEDYYCLSKEISKVIIDQIEAREGLVYEEINLKPLKAQVVAKS